MEAGSSAGEPGGRQSATYRYAHPGHDRIARESLELKQREDELRERWKEMGFQLFQVSSDNETPFSLPDPIPVAQPDPVSMPQHTPAAPSPAPARDHTDSVTSPPVSDVMPARHSVTSAVKVRPHEDSDLAEERPRRQIEFSPADETPIQREIRLATEREQLLRRSRGLPENAAQHRLSVGSASRGLPDSSSQHRLSLGSDSGARRLSSSSATPSLDSTSDTAPAASSGNGAVKISMRQLANSRLALELEREKQRELDLRQLGCISTISEERRSITGAAADATGCHVNGHATGSAAGAGGTWLIEREVELVEQRERELQQQRSRLSTISITSDDMNYVNEMASSSTNQNAV